MFEQYLDIAAVVGIFLAALGLWLVLRRDVWQEKNFEEKEKIYKRLFISQENLIRKQKKLIEVLRDKNKAQDSYIGVLKAELAKATGNEQALELLFPKKVIERRKDGFSGTCPNCRSKVNYADHQFCGWCGQKLDWREE